MHLTATADRWLKENQDRLKRNTYKSYAQNFRDHLLPTLGDWPLHGITRQHLKTLLAQKKKAGLAPNSLRLILAPLSKLYTDAIDAGLVQMNPALRPSKLAQVRGKKQAIDIFTVEEEQTILAAAERYAPKHYPIIFLLFRTGLRLGEALALTWADLDLLQGSAVIAKNWTHGHLELSTKTGRTRRVDLSTKLCDVLQGWREQQMSESEMKDTVPPTLLFPGRFGGHLDGKSWYTLWCKLLVRCHVRFRPPHHLRHTYASRLLANGESIVYVKDQLGHGSIQMTVDTYGHLIPGTNRQAVNKLDSA
ncbi:MAG: tyrosine-type recombinase/integrase [Nitrospirales bacterium]|nr:tyrosine-type recombinase/integrase [Nitrospirales bacterium]